MEDMDQEEAMGDVTIPYVLSRVAHQAVTMMDMRIEDKQKHPILQAMLVS